MTDTSRRDVLRAVGGGGLFATGVSLAGCAEALGATGDEAAVEIIKDPFFIVDKNGEQLGEEYTADADIDEPLFDPLAEGPPMKRIFDAGVEAYSGTSYEVAGEEYTLEVDSELFLQGLVDSRRVATRPPEGYDPESPGEGTWPALTWNDYRTVDAEARLDPVREGGEVVGTEFEVELEGAIPNGLYTFWVVKLGEGGIRGFHPLGDNEGGENVLRVDENGDGSLTATNEGGPLNGFPGFQSPDPGLGFPADIRDEGQFWLAAAYHYDDQTWAFYPGPNHLVHFRLVFDYTG